MDGDGQEGNASINGEVTPLSVYNNRNHRVDVLGFPAHGCSTVTRPMTARIRVSSRRRMRLFFTSIQTAHQMGLI